MGSITVQLGITSGAGGRAEAQKQIRPSYRFTERLGALELAKLFRKEEERAKNEEICFVIKIIFCWIISQ